MNNKDIKKVNILDVTIRDGSYVNNFQFTPQDVGRIVSGLAMAGVRLIEIGHGYGLGASSPKYGIAAATDRQYFKAAAENIGNSVLSTIILPGIGGIRDIDMAIDYKLGIIRVAPNVTQVEQAEKLIKHSKKKGLTVSVNLLKSYLVNNQKLLEAALLAEDFGADIIYLVDSAGGMLTDEVKDKVRLFKRNIKAAVGFHAHNNLSLALANSLVAVEEGCDYIDCSLHGMGRSAGNTQTEIMVGVLKRKGYETGINLNKVLDVSDGILKPLMPSSQGIEGLPFMYGYAQLHSSFEKIIAEYSEKFKLSKNEIIMELGSRKVVMPDEPEVYEVVKNLLRKKYSRTSIADYVISGEFSLKAEGLAISLVEASKKYNKPSMFVVTSVPGENAGDELLAPYIRDAGAFVYGVAEVKNTKSASDILQAIDGLVDYIVVDVEKKTAGLERLDLIAKKTTRKSVLLTYKDNDAWVDAITTFTSQLMGNIEGIKAVIVGCTNLGGKIALWLTESGANVTIADSDKMVLEGMVNSVRSISGGLYTGSVGPEEDAVAACKSARILLGAKVKTPCINASMVMAMDQSGIIIDAGIGTLSKGAIKVAREKGINIYRLDTRAGLAGILLNLLQADYLKNNVMGKARIAGINVVAGGVIGEKGDLILDSINDPKQVIGVATGDGRVSYTFGPAAAKRKKIIEKYISEKKV